MFTIRAAHGYIEYWTEIMKAVPYWTDNTPKPAGVTSDGPPSQADVVIIGAGITGLTAARRLADRGRDVVVVDAMDLGDGASYVNGGQVNFGLKPGHAELRNRYGQERAVALWNASVEAVELVERIPLEDGFDAGFRRTGAVSLAYRESRIEGMRSYSQELRDDFDYETTVVVGEELKAFIDSDLFPAGLVSTQDGALDPAKYGFGLASAAAGRGARIVEQCEVTSIARAGGGFAVATTRGPIAAGDVLLATNGYTPRKLVPSVRRQIVPIGSYMVATTPLAEDVAERLMPGDAVFWTQRRFLNYFRKSHDNRLLFGGRPNLSPNLDLEAVANGMRASIAEVFPELEDIEITHVWGGKLAASFDLLPHLGQTEDGVWYAVGYGGHGVGLATYLGTAVGDLITGISDTNPFLGLPHPTRPYYHGSTWFLPAGGLLFRTLDRLGR